MATQPDKPAAGSVELVPVDAELDAIVGLFTGEAEYKVSPQDPQQVTRDILTQILTAETEEDLWSELPTWSTKDCVGKRFKIEAGSSIYPSKYTADDGTKGAFLSARVVDLDSGERGVLNTSATRIAGKILWMARHDALPVDVEIVKRGESAAGFDILDLRKLSD